MADKFASPQAEDKAEELGVVLEDIEATGTNGATVADVEKAAGGSEESYSEEDKFLAFANPELGSYRAQVYPEDNPSNPRSFYRNPELHPDGPEAQMVSEEEFAKYNHTINGVFTLSRKGDDA